MLRPGLKTKAINIYKANEIYIYIYIYIYTKHEIQNFYLSKKCFLQPI